MQQLLDARLDHLVYCFCIFVLPVCYAQCFGRKLKRSNMATGHRNVSLRLLGGEEVEIPLCLPFNNFVIFCDKKNVIYGHIHDLYLRLSFVCNTPLAHQCEQQEKSVIFVVLPAMYEIKSVALPYSKDCYQPQRETIQNDQRYIHICSEWTSATHTALSKKSSS